MMRRVCRFLLIPVLVMAVVTGINIVSPVNAGAKTVTGPSVTETYGGYTGTATAVLNYEPYSYVSFTSRLNFSHLCIPGSVKCNTVIYGGMYIAKNTTYVNAQQAKSFTASASLTDVRNADYGGTFWGMGTWTVAGTPFCLYTSSPGAQFPFKSRGVYKEAVSASGETLVAVVDEAGKLGYVKERELDETAGLSPVETLAFISACNGKRYINTYDITGEVIEGKYLVEYKTI